MMASSQTAMGRWGCLSHVMPVLKAGAWGSLCFGLGMLATFPLGILEAPPRCFTSFTPSNADLWYSPGFGFIYEPIEHQRGGLGAPGTAFSFSVGSCSPHQ